MPITRSQMENRSAAVHSVIVDAVNRWVGHNSDVSLSSSSTASLASINTASTESIITTTTSTAEDDPYAAITAAFRQGMSRREFNCLPQHTVVADAAMDASLLQPVGRDAENVADAIMDASLLQPVGRDAENVAGATMDASLLQPAGQDAENSGTTAYIRSRPLQGCSRGEVQYDVDGGNHDVASNVNNSGCPNDRCVICLAPYHHGDVVTTLACLHAYHRTCARKWLLRRRTCPVCRSDAATATVPRFPPPLLPQHDNVTTVNNNGSQPSVTASRHTAGRNQPTPRQPRRPGDEVEIGGQTGSESVPIASSGRRRRQVARQPRQACTEGRRARSRSRLRRSPLSAPTQNDDVAALNNNNSSQLNVTPVRHTVGRSQPTPRQHPRSHGEVAIGRQPGSRSVPIASEGCCRPQVASQPRQTRTEGRRARSRSLQRRSQGNDVTGRSEAGSQNRSIFTPTSGQHPPTVPGPLTP